MRCLLLLFAIAGGVNGLHGQTVRGTVSEKESNARMGGAFVVLLDSAGVRRTAALTNQNGIYFVRAPFAGRFRVRVELIGHETATSAPLSVSQGENIVADIALPIAAIEIDAVSVIGDRRCVARPDADGQSARLWEEMRKALTLTSWTEKERIARFQTRQYDRELRLGTLAVVWEGSRTSFSEVRPYRAVSPDSLAEFGFVRSTTADSTLYHGPDAEVLLSDQFLDSHCFRATRGAGEAKGLVGLAFEPMRGRRVPDISGTLWLDPKNSELKYIEFTYTGISRGLNVPGVGGRTYFRRLPNGAWIVDRWFIRMPMLRQDARGALHAYGLLEGGGEIVDVQVAGASLPSGRIKGTVYDSIRNAPLRKAFVYLSGTSHSALTDSAGYFAIDNVAGGTYLLGLSHPSFDSLPVFPEAAAISITPPDETIVQLAAPSMATLIARACPQKSGGGVIAGEILESSTLAEDAVVRADYRLNGQPYTIRAKPEASRRYVLCGLPIRTPIAIRVGEEEPKLVEVPQIRFLHLNLEAL